MVNNFPSANNSSIRRNCYPFFIDPVIDKTKRKKEHEKEIFGIYDKWSTGHEILFVDSDTTIQTSIPQVFPIVTSNDEPDIEEMALMHLKSYSKAYPKYDDVLKFQTQLNQDKKEIDDSIKKGIKSRLGIDNNYALEEMLRYYYDVIGAYRKLQEGLPFRRDDFLSTYGMTIAGLNKPSSNNDEVISQHISLIYPEVIEKLEKIKSKMPDYDKLISAFRKSLKHVKAIWVLGLKGKCPVENELSLRYRSKLRLKKIFHVP